MDTHSENEDGPRPTHEILIHIWSDHFTMNITTDNFDRRALLEVFEQLVYITRLDG